MQRLLFATVVLSLGACSGIDGTAESSDISGVAAAPGTPSEPTELGAALAPDLGAAPATALLPETDSKPWGVVLDDGRVVSEEEARGGLAPKADRFRITRLQNAVNDTTSTTRILSSTTHICGLGLIWGTLNGDGGFVKIERTSTQWKLSARTTSGGQFRRSTLDAICYEIGAFTPGPGGGFLLSDPFSIVMTGAGKQTIPTWWGDAATVMTAAGGFFAGGGEVIRVSHNSVTNQPSTLTVGTLQRGTHVAGAHSIFVGVGGGAHVPLFVGPGDAIGNLKAAGEFTHFYDASDSFHHAPTPMARTSEAFCFLTMVTGHWGNTDSFVHIFPQDGRWMLRAFANASNTVSANAACYRLAQ
jgi:hypothetical protein